MYSDEDGALAVRFARAVIEERLGLDGRLPDLTDIFNEESGAFVTLVTHPRRELRGCIGYIEAVKPLGSTIADVAVSAAIRDPRFPAVDGDEMSRLAVEVSLLTPLERIEATGEDLIDHIEVMMPIVEERMRATPPDRGFLFDGFPRTIPQAEGLFKAAERVGAPIDKVIYLNTPADVIVRRLASRRVCRGCGAVYNTVTMPSKVDGVCDA